MRVPVKWPLGARSVGKADVGLSVTGIAGPDGGTAEKPVGTFFIGLGNGSDKHSPEVSCFRGRVNGYGRLALCKPWIYCDDTYWDIGYTGKKKVMNLRRMPGLEKTRPASEPLIRVRCW